MFTRENRESFLRIGVGKKKRTFEYKLMLASDNNIETIIVNTLGTH